MTIRPCPQEAEIRRLLELGHWPQSAPAELRAHAESCRACGDLVLLTVTFRSARAAASATAQLPPPGVLWWRAQLRRRNAAVARIQRPLIGAQLFAFAVTLLVAGAIVLSQAKTGLRVFASAGGWLRELTESSAFHLQSLWPTAFPKTEMSLGYLVPALALLALLGGVVVFLASEKQ